MFGEGRRQVFALEVEAGAEGVFVATRRCDVALGADHGAQRPALRGGRQAGDLPANALQRQLGGGREVADVGGGGEDREWRAGQAFVAGVGAPVVALAAQAYCPAAQQGDPGGGGQGLAQRGRMDPAGFGIEQAAGGQGDAGEALGLLALQAVQQVGGEGCGQLRLALRFLGVEGQLQYAAGVPVVAAPQAFEQPAGMAEAAEHQARQRRAVGREFQVEHALGVARGFPGEAGMAFDQGHLPAARGEAGGAGAAGQAAADHQCRAAPGVGRGACVPGLAGVRRRPLVGAAEHLALLSVARYPLHGETGLDQPAANETGAGESAQGRLRRRQSRQFGEQYGRPHVRVLRRGEAIEEPGVDPRVELRQALQGIAQQQGQADPSARERQALEARVHGKVLAQQGLAPGRQFRP